jgi:hypothetical protein
MWSPPDTYALLRLDLPRVRTHGWQVRIQRRGVKYAKFFADRVHGGLIESYRAAISWRDEALATLDQSDAMARVCQPSPRNSSGVVGVSKVSIRASNGVAYIFWQATWSPSPGKRCCVKFSIRRHGDQEAYRLAVQAREQGIRSTGPARGDKSK